MAYLTAKEAGALAFEAQSLDGSFMRTETDRIMDQILIASKQGRTSCKSEAWLHKVVQDRHKNLGYSVKAYSDQRGGNYTEISW